MTSAAVTDETGRLKSELRALLAQLILIAQVPLEQRVRDQRSAFEDLEPDADWSVDLEWWRYAAYYPSHPRIRKQTLSHSQDRQTKSMTGLCQKHAPQKGVKMPGFLVVYCAIHACVIGFEMMDFAESERTVFRLLTTRWKKMPKVVFYDNSCNTYNFCMVREPGLFQDVQFIIDGLHWASHIECSPAFNPTLYVVTPIPFFFLSVSAPEQPELSCTTLV